MKSLTSIIIKNAKRQEKQETIKEKILSFLAFAIVFGFLATMMIVISFSVTKKLKEINQEYTFINILLLMNFIILFAKSIFESLNVLYFSKDLKILLRMPIKSKDIVHAKLINMIISEYQMEFIMLAIPMIVYGIIASVGVVFYLYMLLILLFVPVIPIIITSSIISIIMRFTNLIKNKNHVMYITIIITAILIDLLLTGLKSNNSQIDLINNIQTADGIANTIAEQFILIKPIMNALTNYENKQGLINITIYTIESIITYVVGVAIISKVYLKGAIRYNNKQYKKQKRNKTNNKRFQKAK